MAELVNFLSRYVHHLPWNMFLSDSYSLLETFLSLKRERDLLKDKGKASLFIHFLELQACTAVCMKPILDERLSKPRRQRQRERHETKGVMSRTTAVHVRYKSLYICSPWSTKQQREMTKFYVFWRNQTTAAYFSYLHLERTLLIHTYSLSKQIQTISKW